MCQAHFSKFQARTTAEADFFSRFPGLRRSPRSASAVAPPTTDSHELFVVPLCNGGDDSVANATAMCANCHATKTRREHDARLATAQSKQHMYDAREDTHKNGCATCTLCKKTRPNGSPHPVCWAIEGKSTVGLAASLAKFAAPFFWVSKPGYR